MRPGFSGAAVRAAEQPLLDQGRGPALMAVAAHGLQLRCRRILRERRGRVSGARTVILAGKGNNGGDGLWAGAAVRRAGAEVVVLPTAGALHEAPAVLVLLDEAELLADNDRQLVVERRHEVLPAAHLAQAREVGFLCALEHVRLDGVEELRDGLRDVGERGGRFGAGVAADGERLGLGEVLGADLEAEGDALCGDGVLELGSVGV